jgi:type IV secretion system protein VirB4
MVDRVDRSQLFHHRRWRQTPEGSRSKTDIAAALSRLPHDPKGGLRELKTQFSNDRLKVLLREQIEADLLKLEQRVHSFVLQLSDFVQIDILSQNECFRFPRRPPLLRH